MYFTTTHIRNYKLKPTLIDYNKHETIEQKGCILIKHYEKTMNKGKNTCTVPAP